MRKFFTLLVTCSVLVLVSPAALATPSKHPLAVTLLELGSLEGGQTRANDINDRGQVVGYSQTNDTSYHAFLWQNGKMRDLTPNDAESSAIAINNRGQVLMRRTRVSGQVSEWGLWKDGRFTLIEGVDTAEFLNERGQVAGALEHPGAPQDPEGPSRNPYVWTSGVRVDMPPIPNWDGHASRIVGFNDRGDVIGIGTSPTTFEGGFVWSQGKITLVPDPRGSASYPADINNLGQVIGFGPGGQFLWSPKEMSYLKPPRGAMSFIVSLLNDRGTIAGSIRTRSGSSHAYVWQEGRLSHIGKNLPGFSYATGINDRVQMIGRFEVFDAHGQSVGISSFFWQNRTFVDLGAGITGSAEGNKISERGQIIGHVYEPTGGFRAVLWNTRPNR
jgi:probable HAF family extracellular repeat protein